MRIITFLENIEKLSKVLIRNFKKLKLIYGKSSSHYNNLQWKYIAKQFYYKNKTYTLDFTNICFKNMNTLE